jgi:hypothetical protein
MPEQAPSQSAGVPADGGMAQLDTRSAHPARVYNYWLGGKDNFAANREAAEQAIVLHLIPDADGPYGIVSDLTAALPPGSYLVISHPASDIRPEQMAEMTRRVNQRMSGPMATMRDLAAITRFFDGFDLLPPGVVQPQQWRPEPATLSPPQVTAWCGVARKK